MNIKRAERATNDPRTIYTFCGTHQKKPDTFLNTDNNMKQFPKWMSYICYYKRSTNDIDPLKKKKKAAQDICARDRYLPGQGASKTIHFLPPTRKLTFTTNISKYK